MGIAIRINYQAPGIASRAVTGADINHCRRHPGSRVRFAQNGDCWTSPTSAVAVFMSRLHWGSIREPLTCLVTDILLPLSGLRRSVLKGIYQTFEGMDYSFQAAAR